MVDVMVTTLVMDLRYQYYGFWLRVVRGLPRGILYEHYVFGISFTYYIHHVSRMGSNCC